MFLTKVQIKNFRNYTNLSVNSFSSINIFSGDNGHGKTSFLEAIYCALRGKSFKPYTGNDFIKEGEATSQVVLDFKEEQGDSKVEAAFIKTDLGFKKKIEYCGKKTSPLFLDKKISLFVFTEESLKAIRQGPGERRSFIDQMLLGNGERETINRFIKILKEKNSLLKSYKKELISLQDLNKLLEVLNEPFLNAAFELTKKRIELLQDLFLNIQIVGLDFFLPPRPSLDFKYLIHGQNFGHNLEAVFKAMQQDLELKKEIEIQAGMSLSGSHKHEIIFLYNGRNSRSFCSQGQQRMFLLTILGTQLKKAEKSLLFLDDALMELDDNNQEKFLRFLEKISCQTFLTNCKKISIKLKKLSFFYVKDGTIRDLYV